MGRAVLQVGRCCVPGCKKDPGGRSAICTACWFDLDEGERAAVRMAQESPFYPEPEMRLVEMAAALVASAEALAKRRCRKDAQRRLKRIREAQKRRLAA